MHERDAITNLFHNCEDAVLATVVEVEGSAYRRPGARMLLGPRGERAGVINGGCLDADLQARAQAVRATGKPQLAVYDSTSPEDIIFGLGLGCRGVVKILLEQARDLDFLHVSSDQQVAVATLFESADSGPSSSVVSGSPAGDGTWAASPMYDQTRLGTRVVWRTSSDGGFQCERNDLPKNDWAFQLANDTRGALESGHSFCRDYVTEGGPVRAFIEVLAPPQPLVIFGAGADVVPLSAMARLLGWNVEVIDLRAMSPDRTVFVDSRYVPPGDLSTRLEVPPGAACVIMTHNFLHDLELLKRLLPSQASYIGILGPRHRTDELLAKIEGDTILPGISPTEAQLARLFAPVGLDMGAETPEEIALSVIAEIQKTRRNKSGLSLREKDLIH